jgi:hypothetical protein
MHSTAGRNIHGCGRLDRRPVDRDPHLLISQVPSVDVTSFRDEDYADPDSSDWGPVWRFALTFDGYRYFGDDDYASSRLGEFSKSVRDSYLELGQLPKLDLALLRTCLFYEQRYWCKWAEFETPGPRVKQYWNELLRAIRAEIS